MLELEQLIEVMLRLEREIVEYNGNVVGNVISISARGDDKVELFCWNSCL